MATTPPIGLCSILSESKRIINAHSRHFLALSVLFILPPSFALTVYPSVSRLLTQSAAPDTLSLLRSTDFGGVDDKPIATGTFFLALIYSVFVSSFSILANGSITYSVFQGFYGRPVKLFSAVKSGLTSFFPVLFTLITEDIFFFGIFLILGFSSFVLISVIQLSGYEIEYSSPYFLAICIILTIVSIIILMILQVNWNLAWVIVVVESTWGFLPLKRSTSLIKGMRSVSLYITLFFGFASSVLLLSSAYVSAATFGGEEDDMWTNLAFVLQIVVSTAGLTGLSLYNFAAHTVLYMYCKAVHGELAWEIAEEFAREYVSLPFDDGKVPHLVSVAYNG